MPISFDETYTFNYNPSQGVTSILAYHCIEEIENYDRIKGLKEGISMIVIQNCTIVGSKIKYEDILTSRL